MKTVTRPAPANRSFTPAERTIIMGVARDLHMLRARSGLTVRDVARQLGWSSHNEVARYEHGAPKGDAPDPGVRMISLRRYFELLKFYFGHLPESTKAGHPAGTLVDKGYNLAIDRMTKATNMTAYDFVVVIQAMHAVGSLPDNDPHLKLVQYLQILGSSARGT